MILDNGQKKRTSFSIESLAISSRNDSDNNNEHYGCLSNDNESFYVPKKFRIRETGTPLSEATPVDSNYNIVNACDLDADRKLTVASAPLFTPSKIWKRKRTFSESSGCSTSGDNLVIDESKSSEEEMAKSSSPGSSGQETDATDDSKSSSGRKKARTAFSADQVRQLENFYTSQKYLAASERVMLAKKLQLKDQQIKTWFQNRRMKEKRQQREEEQAQGFHIPTGGVDVSQLAAIGLPCPPPYGTQARFKQEPTVLPHYTTNTVTSTTDSIMRNRPIPAALPLLPEYHVSSPLSGMRTALPHPFPVPLSPIPGRFSFPTLGMSTPPLGMPHPPLGMPVSPSSTANNSFSSYNPYMSRS